MNDQLQQLPDGVIRVEGGTVSVGEWVLGPGRYAIPGGAVLEVGTPDEERTDRTG